MANDKEKSVYPQIPPRNDEEMRLDCLRIAAGDLTKAKDLYEWVVGANKSTS